MLRAAHDKHLQERLAFLRKVSCFASWSKGRIMRLAQAVVECTYKHNEVVAKQGDLADNVLIVQEGELVLEVSVVWRSPT